MLFTMIAILVTVAAIFTVILTTVAAPVLILILVAVVLTVTIVTLVSTALEEVALLHLEDTLVRVNQIGDLIFSVNLTLHINPNVAFDQRTLLLFFLFADTSYDRGRSFFSLYRASRETLATFTTLKRTPGMSPTA